MAGKRANKSKTPAGKKQKKVITSDTGHPPRKTGLCRKFDTPSQFVEFLLNPVPYERFEREHWEKTPLVLQGREGAGRFWSPHFTKADFFRTTKAKEILFGRDISACKYHGGKRTNFEKKGRASEAKLLQLFEKEGATLQVHQPQRWMDALWEVLEMLESFFGCLVGCNAYITPPSSQGLAPHHDDVEVFVIQTEGTKQWTLYEPPMELPRTYSKDFAEDEIGAQTHEFTLQPGDLLYMPRGTIHQACTPEGSDTHSTHITISTYQNHSIGEYLKSIVPDLIEEVMDSTVELRRGLPVGFLPGTNMTKTTVENAIGHLHERLKSFSGALPRPKDLVRDFMLTRLPPFGVNREALSEATPEGKPPVIGDGIMLAYPSHVTFLVEEDDEKECLLLTSVFNNREDHMMYSDEHGDDETGIVRFPGHFASAVKQLCENGDFIGSDTLDLPSNEEKMVLLTTLWSLHLLEVR